MSAESEVEEPSYIDQIVLNVSECFVYKVPPLRTASGHRAEDWGLANPLFTGFLRVTQADTKLKITVYAYRDPTKLLASEDNLAKFAECPIEVPPKGDITPFVDAVIDSSRYYVLRIKDPASTRTTLLGVGFRERETAFDLKNVLNEYVRFVDRMDTAKRLAEMRASGDDSADKIELHSQSSAGGEGGGDDGGEVFKLRDLTLKEGSKISIPLPNIHGSQSGKRRGEGVKLKSFGSFGSIAPPPPPGSTVFSSYLPAVPGSPSPSTTSSTDAADGSGNGSGNGDSDEEEWGAFEGLGQSTSPPREQG